MQDRIAREEIEKWLGKIEPLVDGIMVDDSRGEEMLTNMNAYISDSKHFLEKGELVKSFEAVVWAWSIFELCHDLGIFRQYTD